MDQGGARIRWLEQAVAELLRKLVDLTARVRRLELIPWAAAAGAGGGGAGGGTYFGCTLSAALAHGASVTGQTVWKMPGRTTVTASGKIYNDGPTSTNDIANGKQVILAPNDDGSYTATGVYC